MAVLAAYVTARLSLRRFRNERSWERQADAYERIIEALGKVDRYLMTWLDHELTRQVPEDRLNEVAKRSKDGRDEINRVVTIGAFLISDEAADRLRQLEKELS